MSAAALQAPALSPPDLLSAPRLSVREALEQLRVSRTTLYRFIRDGCRGVHLRPVKVGGRTYLIRDELIRFLQATQPDGASQEPGGDGDRPGRAPGAGRRRQCAACASQGGRT
jgi:excisionase family DNA binding protein